MDVSTIGRGFVLGFAVAAVVGPIGMLCIRRTLSSGFVIGFLSGLGAAVADATYASLAAFGVSALTSLLVEQRLWLRLVGGTFLLYLGVRTVRAAPSAKAATTASVSGLLSAFASTLALTLSNPMTILSFVGIFAGLGLSVEGGMLGAAVLVVGVFLGSAAWWLVLAGAVSAIRGRLTPRVFRTVNVLSGLVIVAFGLQALLSLSS
ncbi:MAG TPA: LysE family transporter [Chloroflexota bacterium]|jgi:threonine/homoserine/homoserine lactone efflux protein